MATRFWCVFFCRIEWYGVAFKNLYICTSHNGESFKTSECCSVLTLVFAQLRLKFFDSPCKLHTLQVTQVFRVCCCDILQYSNWFLHGWVTNCVIHLIYAWKHSWPHMLVYVHLPWHTKNYNAWLPAHALASCFTCE